MKKSIIFSYIRCSDFRHFFLTISDFRNLKLISVLSLMHVYNIHMQDSQETSLNFGILKL